jgi:hypothetical protein
MFGLSYLFYPWGFIVQGLAIVHFVRRRPENYWFYIIFFGGFLGASVYIVAEVLPDLGLLRGVFQGFGRRSRIQKVETDILDNPSLGLNDLAAAIPDLERVVAGDRKFDYYRAAGLLANAYARTGQLERANQLFAEVTQISTTPETLFNYASFLKSANRREEAREWLQKLLAKKRTLPRYMQRRERPWFRKGKALMKELAST